MSSNKFKTRNINELYEQCYQTMAGLLELIDPAHKLENVFANKPLNMDAFSEVIGPGIDSLAQRFKPWLAYITCTAPKDGETISLTSDPSRDLINAVSKSVGFLGQVHELTHGDLIDQLTEDELVGLLILSWELLAKANFAYGMAAGLTLAGHKLKAYDVVARVKTQQGRKGADAMLAKDSKGTQAAKAKAKEAFNAWQDGTGERFKNYADFGRKTVERHKDVLTDARKPAEWCTKWQKARRTP